MLYTKNGSYPKLLPFRITLSNGLTRTDPTTFTPEEILDAGYIAIPEPIVGENQVKNWDYENGAWIVRDKTQLELEQEELARIQKIKTSIVKTTQDRLDSFARTREYDGILSACTYATSPTTKFATEGQYCVAQRDATWAKLYEILNEVESATRPMPNNFSEIETELPILEWPQ